MRKDEFESRNLHQNNMRIVLIADTHNRTPELPDGDILIHAGDATSNGTREEVERFDAWLGTLKFRHILFTPGNHDFYLESDRNIIINATMLISEAVIIDGLIFWASPYTSRFGGWAFMRSEERLADIWKCIPDKVDVLITHSPPKGILDYSISGSHLGSKSLLERSSMIEPKVHVFGHIHEGAGQKRIGKTTFVNASVLNEYYQNVNKPVVIDIGV